MEKIYQQSCPKKEDLRQTGKSHIFLLVSGAYFVASVFVKQLT